MAERPPGTSPQRPAEAPGVPGVPARVTGSLVGDVQGLRRGRLGLSDVIAQSVAVIGPALSGGVLTYFAATKAGGATPLAFLLAMVGTLFIGGVVAEFGRQLPSAGSIYTYTAAPSRPCARTPPAEHTDPHDPHFWTHPRETTMNDTTFRRPRTLAAAALTALLAGGGLWALGGAAPAGAADGNLRVTEKLTAFTTHDLGRKGLSLGDRAAATTDVLDTGGAKVGTGAVDCAYFAGRTAATAKYHCTETFMLKGGQILAGGVYDFAEKRTVWAILGGTGKYRGASGLFDATATSAETFDAVFRFGD